MIGGDVAKFAASSAVESGYVFTVATRAAVAASDLQKIFDLGIRRIEK